MDSELVIQIKTTAIFKKQISLAAARPHTGTPDGSPSPEAFEPHDLLNPPADGLPLRRQFPAALLIKRKDLVQDTCAVISIPNFCNICYNELTRREIWQMIRKGTMALLNPASLLFREV